MVKLFHPRSFFASAGTGELTRDGKSVHTIRDSCYHKEKGAEKTWGGGSGSKHVKGTINYQLLNFTPLGLVPKTPTGHEN